MRERRQLSSYRCSLTFVQVPPMDVGTDHKRNRIGACWQRPGVYWKAKLLAGNVAISAVKDFALVDDDLLSQLVGPDIILELLEFLTLHQRKDVGDGMEFVLLLPLVEITGRRSRSGLVGFCGGHDTPLPSTIACNAASHSLRSHRLEPPIFTGLGRTPCLIFR